jgi:hypothetical protein
MKHSYIIKYKGVKIHSSEPKFDRRGDAETAARVWIDVNAKEKGYDPLRCVVSTKHVIKKGS